MTTETPTPVAFAARAQDWAQYLILAIVAGCAMAGAFTHMHDWTITALSEALRDRGRNGGVPDWFGWANAAISELLPTSSFLSIRKRQGQGRSITAPMWIFLGSAVLSIMAQLSATGARFPHDEKVVAILPAAALMILVKLIFSDVEFAAKQADRDAQRAHRRAVTVARRAKFAAEQAARKAELAAEHAAELDRRNAELAAAQARRDAEHAAELERRRLTAIAAAEAEQTRIEQAAITERECLAAEERRAEREARERIAAAEREAERRRLDEAARIRAEGEAEAARISAAAEARRIEAEAARIEADAEARRLAAARVAAARHEAQAGSNDDEGTSVRRRRPRHETQALADDVLMTLPAGTPREVAVAAVAAALRITDRYARDFVPEGWTAGNSAAGSVADHEGGGTSSAGRRYLTVVGSA